MEDNRNSLFNRVPPTAAIADGGLAGQFLDKSNTKNMAEST